MIWLLPLAGAAIGAMANKKNPMKGALMGGALGATGGLLAPAAAGGAAAAGGSGLLGAGATGAASAAGTGAAAMGPMMGSQVAMGSVIPGLGQYATGYTAQGLLGAAGTAAKSAAPYAQLAQQSGLFAGGEQEMPQASPVTMGQAVPNELPALVQSLEQGAQAQRQADEERKKRRYSLLGGM